MFALRLQSMTSTPLPPYLSGLAFPVVFEKALAHAQWDLDKLSLRALKKDYNGRVHKFRVGRKRSRHVVWEGRQGGGGG